MPFEMSLLVEFFVINVITWPFFFIVDYLITRPNIKFENLGLFFFINMIIMFMLLKKIIHDFVIMLGGKNVIK